MTLEGTDKIKIATSHIETVTIHKMTITVPKEGFSSPLIQMSGSVRPSFALEIHIINKGELIKVDYDDEELRKALTVEGYHELMAAINTVIAFTLKSSKSK